MSICTSPGCVLLKSGPARRPLVQCSCHIEICFCKTMGIQQAFPGFQNIGALLYSPRRQICQATLAIRDALPVGGRCLKTPCLDDQERTLLMRSISFTIFGYPEGRSPLCRLQDRTETAMTKCHCHGRHTCGGSTCQQQAEQRAHLGQLGLGVDSHARGPRLRHLGRQDCAAL
jgi:hypothetical protein